MHPDRPSPTLISQLFPCDSLLEKERTPRPALQRWASQLLRRLDGVPPGPSGADQLAGILNNAALIEVFRGDLVAARALCELQLNWIHGLCEEHGAGQYAHLAAQPWINLGRLLRIQGQAAASLEYFSLALDAAQGTPRQLGPVLIDAETWAQIERSRSIRGILDTIYLLDSLKVYLRGDGSLQALEFMQRARALLGEDALLDEAELLARVRLGQWDHAEALLAKPTWSEGGFVRLVGLTYSVAMLVAHGAQERAQRLAQQLEANVQRLNLASRRDERSARYLYRLGAIAQCAGAVDAARRLWSAGLLVARRTEDVPLELSCLEALLAGATGAEHEQRTKERATLLEECLYVTLLKPRGLEQDPARAADPLFGKLLRRLEGITGQRNSHVYLQSALGASRGSAAGVSMSFGG